MRKANVYGSVARRARDYLLSLLSYFYLCTTDTSKIERSTYIYSKRCKRTNSLCQADTHLPSRNCSNSLLEQEDQVTFPGPRMGDMRNLSGSQLFPSCLSPSWFIPRLENIVPSCKQVCVCAYVEHVIFFLLMAHLVCNDVD